MAKSRRKGILHVGTSGWSYRWEGFYPGDLPIREYLSYYGAKFTTVEINYSFYHLPRPATYEKWRDETPDGFVFAVKLSRFITHVKKLSGIEPALKAFLENATTLGRKLGPVLVQLPPSFGAQIERLAQLLESVERVRNELSMAESPRIAVEFRHRTWFEGADGEAAVDVLRRHGAAFVFGHSSRYPYPKREPITADFVYLRFHGPREMFASRYGAAGLGRWRPKIGQWLARGLDVYAYFNNDMHGYAVSDAKTLLGLVTG